MNAVTKFCARCETEHLQDAFDPAAAEAVCLDGLLDREIQRYYRLGGFHPDWLPLRKGEEPLHVKNRSTLAKLKKLARKRGFNFLDLSEDGKNQREKAEAVTTKFVPVDR